MAEGDQSTTAPSIGMLNEIQTDHFATQSPANTTICPVPIESNNSSATIELNSPTGIRENVPLDERETNEEEENSLEDSNEVEENVHSPVIAEPESIGAAQLGTRETDKQEISTGDSKESSLLLDEDENNDNKTEIDAESSAEPKTLSDLPENQQQQQQISRRAFLRHQSIAEGIKRRKKLFAKRRNPKRKRRKRFNKNSVLSPSSQTRQSSTTTAGYGNLIIHQDPLPSASSTGSGVSSLTETIRQRFPSLANPLQLSAAVQRLIMSKQSGQILAGGGQFQPSQGFTRSRYRQQQSTSSQLPDFAQEQQLSPASQATLFQHTNGLMDNPRLADQLAMGQWASSDELPTLVASSGSAEGGGDIISAGGHSNPGGSGRGAIHEMSGKPVIPIEIIGLDPSVGSSILDSLSNEPATLNPESSTSIRHQQVSANLQAGYRANRNSAHQVDHHRLRAPSILHVHHFHTQGRPISRLPVLPAHQLDGSSEPAQSDALPASPVKGLKEPNEESGEQASGDQPARPGAKVTQQQVFVNQKGELVYLTVEDQSGMQAHSNGQEVASEVPDQQQQQQQQVVGDEQVESLPQSEMADFSGDQQQQQQQQESASSNANEPTIYLKASHLASALKQSSRDSTRPQLFVTNTGQTISLMGANSEQSADPSQASGGETESDRQQQLLMVAYRPQSSNSTSSHVIRAAYNDGQESKTSSMSNANSEIPRGINQLFKSAQIETISAANQANQQHQELGQPAGGGLMELVDVHPAKVLPSKAIVQLDPDNRVPNAQQVQRARPLFVERGHGSAAMANKETGKDELAYLAANWLKAPISADTQSNGYANHARVPIMGFKNMSSSSQQHGYHQSLVENSALFKHLQQVVANGNKMQQQQQQIQIHPPQVRFNGNLLSGNSTKMTNDELLGLIQGLHRQEVGGGLKGNNTLQQLSLPNIRLSSSYPKSELPNLAVLDQASPKPTGRFELTQASNQSPAKFMRNLQGVDGSIHSNRSSSSPVYHKEPKNRLIMAGNHAIFHESSPTGKQAPNSTGVLLNSPVKPSIISLESNDSEDGSGLSNVALAFIFIVSLITLTIITASMIYRHKRRSVSRCADLQGRSRLNLTQRTKHFVCSNFVNPNDVASIKSINLTTANSSLDKTKSSSSRGSDTTGTSTISSIPGISRLQANRYNNSSNLGAKPGQPLSSFNHSSQVVEKYQRNIEANNPVADIKTLNTRLQKPSYLKSLISRPDCLLSSSSSKSRDAQLVSSRADSAGGSCYLNIRHRSADISGRQQQQQQHGDGKLEDSSCLHNRSFKKIDPDLHQNHSSSTKNHPASSSPKRGKHSLGGARRMSTIISVEDPFDPESTADGIHEPGQMKSRTNVARRLAKLNNLPIPKPPDLTQIDRL